MAERNLYVVLGAPRGESPAGIRAAFLDRYQGSGRGWALTWLQLHVRIGT